MAKPLTLVIDQGTHATRAFIFDDEGKVCASAFQDISLKRFGADRAEQDGSEIIASVQAVIQEVLADSAVKRNGLACAGLATQRSSVVAWNKHTGEPLGPVLSWLDRRAAAWLGRMDLDAGDIQQRTGLAVTPHYGASKLRWYLDHVPAVKRAHREGQLAMGPLVSYVLFHLLKERPLLVDHANASRTQLWNLDTRDWDPKLLDLFGVPLDALPSCRPICHDYGLMRGTDIPVTAVNGDQTSALYCLGRLRKDTAVVNLGTGAFILFLTGKKRVHAPRLLSGLASSQKDRGEYLVEGTVNGAGVALDWAARQWGIPDIIQTLSAGLGDNEEPPLFINTVGGLGSPWWQPGPDPTLMGEGGPRQKAVAVAESILFLLKVNLEVLDETCPGIRRIQVSGNLARFDGICRRLADLTQRAVYRPAETEATARGIAWLAFQQPRHWPKPGRGRVFKPKANPSLEERYKRFCRILTSNYEQARVPRLPIKN